MFVKELEVAVTVDMGCVDELAVDSAMNFLARVLLRKDRPNKDAKRDNAVKTEPLQKYVTGKKRNNCNFCVTRQQSPLRHLYGAIAD